MGKYRVIIASLLAELYLERIGLQYIAPSRHKIHKKIYKSFYAQTKTYIICHQVDLMHPRGQFSVKQQRRFRLYIEQFFMCGS